MASPPPSPPLPVLFDNDAQDPDAVVVDPPVVPEVPALAHPPSGSVAPPRARGTRRGPDVPGEQLRALIYAPEPTRAAWIESELARAPMTVTIQVGRRVRTIVSALIKDPPPRPQLLIVDIDAITPPELLELHAIRNEGWPGRLIALGRVPVELRMSLAIDHVLTAPFIRDSLLDCAAGTRHATETVQMPAFWMSAFARDRDGG